MVQNNDGKNDDAGTAGTSKNDSRTRTITEEAEAERSLWRSGSLPHLPYSLMADFIRNRLDAGDTELVEIHLEECSLCAAETADLRTMALTLQEAGPAEVSEAEEKASPGRGWTRFLQGLFLWNPGRPAVWAAASALGGLLAGGALCWALAVAPLQKDKTERNAELLALRNAVRALPTPTPTAPLLNRSDVEKLRTALAEASTRLQKEAETRKLLETRLAAQTERLNQIAREQETPDPQGVGGNKSSAREPLPKTLRLPDLTLLAMATNTGTRGQGEETVSSFPVLSPVATKTLGTRPTLRWQPLPGAKSYRVTARSEEGEVFVQSEKPLTQTQWTAPQLPRGRVLEWQAVALDSGGNKIGETPVARFMILTLAEEATYRARLARHGGGDAAAVVAAAEAGLLELARQRVEALLMDSPSPAVRERAEAWRTQLENQNRE